AELVFLDEPTTGLDPQARRGLWELIGDLKTRRKTVFLTTHYMEEAERLCDRVAVMDHGRIIALDSPQALIDQHFVERAVEFASPVLVGDEDLENLPGVTRLQTEEEGRITIYTTDAGLTVDALMRHAAAHRAPLENLVVRQASLEDVFLKLTGRRIRE
ncbi:MAG: AAA family ATPase, partial [Firmicutes bacterium]|nr:AAA family ATPase [Bacillota bacterium]